MKLYKSIIVVAAQALLIKAEKVTFKVLAVNGTPYVNIGGKQYEMTLKEYPLFKTEIDVDLPVDYNYGIVYADGNADQESFTRNRKKGEDSLNEFYDRQVTVVKHPLLPKAFKSFEYYKPSKLFDDTHVDTIIIKCDPNDLQNMYQNPTNRELETQAEVIYASPYTVKTFKQAKFSLSGQSTRKVPKLSYKLSNLKTEKNKELYNRTSIKLRAEHMDPSFLRDKIYGDILNTLGAPAAQNKFARVFINGEAVGLFDLSDDISNNRYLRETFNKGEKYKTTNPLFKADYCAHCEVGAVYADLGYHGEDATDLMYAAYIYKGKEELTGGDDSAQVAKEIIPLTKEINAYATGSSNKMPIDIDSFLKFMVVEFLNGAMDNFWSKPGNYFLFKDNEKNKWFFHDADFHYSFGVGGEQDLMMNILLSQYPPGFDEIPKDRPPLDAMLSRQENKDKFNEIFQRLFKTSYHKESLFPRIDSLASLIREDVGWDFSLQGVNQAADQEDTQLEYTVEDFDQQVTSVENNGKYGIVPLKHFIGTRINLISNELGIKIPEKVDDSLGYYENPSSSGLSLTACWSVISILIVLVSYIIY